MEIDTLQNVRSNRRQVTVDTVAPGISSVSIVPRPFAPTAPAAAQDIEVRFSVSQSQATLDAVGVDLVAGGNFLAVPLVSGFAGDGDYVARCYGCADSLSDGITRVEVWSADPATNQSIVVDSIDVNLLGPEVAVSYPTADAAMDAWMASPGHCANVMRATYHALGVGYVFIEESTYRHHWTQSFGGR